MTKNKRNNLQPTTHNLRMRRGFTMVETLIAIAVLLLALVGPLTIAAQGLITARFAKDQIVAFYLAQEAVELIRNQRDHNALANEDWDSGLGPCFTPNGCQVDAADKNFSACSARGCDLLYKHDDSGFYSYNTGVGYEPTRFTRIINMTEISETEMQAEVSITWNNGPISKSFTIQEHFLDWQ